MNFSPPYSTAVYATAIAFAIHFYGTGDFSVSLGSPIVATLCVVGGTLLVNWANTLLAKAAGPSGGAGEPPPPAQLVTEGPFEFSRNPVALGLFMIQLGIGFFMGTYPFFLTALGFAFVISFRDIPAEETELGMRFGNEYLAYCARVGRWMTAKKQTPPENMPPQA